MIARLVIILVLVALMALLLADRSEAAYRASSTAYCLTGTMADGTYTRPGSVASNRHPLGTRLWVRGPGGRWRWVVRDRIGHSSELDFWQPTCGRAFGWGRRTVTVKVGWPRKHCHLHRHRPR
jgi:3D (Asp-Asp-Asp) domain-containing protein